MIQENEKEKPDKEPYIVDNKWSLQNIRKKSSDTEDIYCDIQ